MCSVHLCITVPTVYVQVQYVLNYPADPVTNQLYMLTTNTYSPATYSAWIRWLAILADVLVP
jgi:hypothetical protein